MTTKLTLSVDARVIARAKRYAESHATSVSRLVETFLGGLGKEPTGEAELPPITRSLAGILKGSPGPTRAYRAYLERKYR
jgi:hypothetical protein